MRERLGTFYRGLLAGRRELGMRLPDVAPFKGYFPADVAFDIYAAHVAHVLVVEARHLVPWSIEHHPAVELDQLLAGASYFARIKPSKRTPPPDIKADRDFMQRPENVLTGELNSDPRIGFEFVTGKTSVTHATLVGATELETLCHLTVWLRDNVGHGPLQDGHIVERMNGLRWLDQRLRVFPGTAVAIANQGCHSAAKLLVDLARSVNIPLLHSLSLDSHTGDSHAMFLDRTHAGLVTDGAARGRGCAGTPTRSTRAKGRSVFRSTSAPARCYRRGRRISASSTRRGCHPRSCRGRASCRISRRCFPIAATDTTREASTNRTGITGRCSAAGS